MLKKLFKREQNVWKFGSQEEFHKYVDEHPEAMRSVSPGGAAARLGVSRQAVYDLIKRGKLRAWFVYDAEIGSCYDVPGNTASYVYISHDDIEQRIAESPKAGRPRKVA